jgi:hypothetical protein
MRGHPDLTQGDSSTTPGPRNPPTRGTGATDATVGGPTATRNPNEDHQSEVKITNDECQGRPTRPVNDQGQWGFTVLEVGDRYTAASPQNLVASATSATARLRTTDLPR